MFRFCRRLSVVVPAFLFTLLTARASAQTCTVTSGGQVSNPQYTGTTFGLTATGGGNHHLYAVTEWGIARFDLTNPAAPSGGVIGMIGIDYSQGSAPNYNGGKVPITGDSHQGPTWFGAGESPDGLNGRAVTDWSPARGTGGGGLWGQVVSANGGGTLTFGQQINYPSSPVGPAIAVASVGSSFFGYYASYSGISMADVTSPNGNPGLSGGRSLPNLGIQPIGNFAGWGTPDLLTAATVSLGGVSKNILVGVSGGQLRVANVNAGGTLSDAGVSATSPALSISVVNVGAKVVIFAAEGAGGIRGYEFTGSSLIRSTSFVVGAFDYLVARGAFPSQILVAHSTAGTIQTFDTKWMSTGAGTPTAGPVLPHAASTNQYRGVYVEAVVANHNAYIYRIGKGAPESNLYTDVLDVSCLVADSTSPPTPGATATNLSAGLRTDKSNYYGDRFTLADASASGVQLLNAYFDTDMDGVTLPHQDFTTSFPALSITGYLPCDANNGGNFATGASCPGSVGLVGTAPAGQSFRYGEQSRNQYGLSTTPAWFTSAPIAFQMPQIVVAGFVGGFVNVITGGTIDASGTQGNTAEATFAWTFGAAGTATGMTPTVPAGATAFGLTVGWPGGYSSSASGTIVQVDLVPAFTMSSTSSTLGGTVTLTNRMQKAPLAILNSVDESVVLGACPGSPSFTYGTLSTNFNTVNQTGTLTAPTVAGTYCVTLKYNYTSSTSTPGAVTTPGQTLNVSNAVLSAFVLGPSTGTVGQSLTFTGNVSGGIAPYRYFWDCNYSSFNGQGNFSIESTNTTMCSYPANGGRTPGLKVTDSVGVSTIVFGNVSITGGSGGGNIAVNVSGSSAPSVGVATTYSASATGGSGIYSYGWACEYTALAGLGQFITGSSSRSCTFTSSGPRQVAVRVTDTGTGSVIGTENVTVGGGANGLAVTVAGPGSGAQNQALTFTAAATGGTAPYTYGWNCDYSSFSTAFTAGGVTNTCTYTSNGTHTVAVKASDSAGGSATNTASTTISGPGLPSSAFTASGPGAISVAGTTYTVGWNEPVTFASAEANASSYAWAFGDGSAAIGPDQRTVTKTYPTKGTYSAALSVTGDGTHTAGSNTSNFTVNVVTPAPSAAFTIAGAQSNAAGTVFTANVGDQLTLTAAEPNASTWWWIFGDGNLGNAKSIQHTYSAIGSYTVNLFVTGDENATSGQSASTFTINVVSCSPNANTLCLNDSRFRATVNWAVPDQGKSGAGNAAALTGDTGYYWFFSPTNIELVLKVVDGRAFNGNFWVFYGALSDVQYDITIKDTVTGNVKTYHNPYHTTASVADVGAFPAAAGTSAKKALAATAITVACVPTTVTSGQPVACTASPSGNYSWNWGEDFPPAYVPGPNPNTHTYTRIGTRQITATTDGGVTTGSTTISVTNGGGGTFPTAISGPATGASGASLTFNATATGGTAPYIYAWACDYSANSPNFTAGSDSMSCSYATQGNHIVGLKVTDSATPVGSSIATKTVNITAPAGPTLPSAAYLLDGATLNPQTSRYETEVGRTVTFTAAETNATSIGWDFGDGSQSTAGSPATHVYQQLGQDNGQLIVVGDGVHTTGINTSTIPISVVPCAADAHSLCLNNGRFKVAVVWNSDTTNGVGTAVPVTSDTGEFWFLSANNIELVLKVVDGTSVNGRFWVFYGALSNLEYTITITDTSNGTVKTYHNPQGTTASLADVNAF